MRVLLLSLVIFMSGCAMFQKPVPVAPKWPDVPPALKEIVFIVTELIQ